jgi:uncharacterized protein YcbK (DUF882 family)
VKPPRYFDIAEFDDRSKPGSGENMQCSTVGMLDEARHRLGKPFKITSGFRTPERNAAVGGAQSSSHLTGYAVDIAAPTFADKKVILKALYEVGFRRFGIMANAIHVDNDPDKSPAVWRYNNTGASDWSALGSLALIARL